MAQHIRNQQKKPEEGMANSSSPKEKFMHIMQRIRHSPKQMIGWILGFILMVILIIVALHYFRLYSFPFLAKYIPQKPAPSSHLQYFFF